MSFENMPQPPFGNEDGVQPKETEVPGKESNLDDIREAAYSNTVYSNLGYGTKRDLPSLLGKIDFSAYGHLPFEESEEMEEGDPYVLDSTDSSADLKYSNTRESSQFPEEPEGPRMPDNNIKPEKPLRPSNITEPLPPVDPKKTRPNGD